MFAPKKAWPKPGKGKRKRHFASVALAARMPRRVVFSPGDTDDEENYYYQGGVCHLAESIRVHFVPPSIPVWLL